MRSISRVEGSRPASVNSAPPSDLQPVDRFQAAPKHPSPTAPPRLPYLVTADTFYNLCCVNHAAEHASKVMRALWRSAASRSLAPYYAVWQAETRQWDSVQTARRVVHSGDPLRMSFYDPSWQSSRDPFMLDNRAAAALQALALPVREEVLQALHSAVHSYYWQRDDAERGGAIKLLAELSPEERKEAVPLMSGLHWHTSVICAALAAPPDRRLAGLRAATQAWRERQGFDQRAPNFFAPPPAASNA